MPRKITATIKDRGTFTRRSDRPYRFIIISKGLREDHIRQQFAQGRVYNTKQLAEYRQVVESGVVPAGYGCLTVDDYRRFVAQTEEQLARLTPEAEEAKVAAQLEAGWKVAGWSQTLASAEKRAQQELKHYAQVELWAVDNQEEG